MFKIDLQKCPICYFEFYIDQKTNSSYCFTKNNNHYVYISYTKQKISSIEIKYKNTLYLWYVYFKTSLQYKKYVNLEKWESLPYFDPDFSDFNKLIEKINTYIY